MTKTLTLFSLFFIFSIQTSFGQSSRSEEQLFLPQNAQALQKKASKQSKSAGTVLYQEDFNAALNSWTSQSNSSPAHQWIWSTSAPSGQYSTNVNVIASPSSGNGFLLLPSDQYNTPTPSNGFQNVNASISSPALTITPKTSVHLSFYQSQRFYGANPNAMYVEVSADSVNWTVFPATNYRSSEASSVDGEYMKINVTQVLANSSTAYLRFVQSGASHYYWMIDDVKLIEGPRNQLEISKLRITQMDTFGLDPIVSVIPQSLVCNPVSKFFIENTGTHPVTAAKCIFEVRQDSTLNGMPGFGLAYIDSFNLQYLINPGQRLDVRVPPIYVNTFPGHFSFNFECRADSVFDTPVFAKTSFSITDSILSKASAQNAFSARFSAAQLQGGGNDSDFVGTIFNGARNTITTMGVFIANDPTNIGVQIVPQVFEYVKSSTNPSGGISRMIAENLVPTTITANMLGSWIILDFAFGTGPQNLQADKLYVAGYRQISSAPNANLVVGRLIEEESQNIQAQSFVYLNHSSPHWKQISQIPAISMNYRPYGSFGRPCAPLVLATKENFVSRKLIKVYPNPSQGAFTLETSNSFLNSEIEIFDLLGKQVYRAINLSRQSQNWQLNLAELENGIYVLKLSQAGRSETHKIIIQH